MAKLTWYEIRPRGEFMMDGRIVHAENHKMARLIPTGNEGIDNVVIQISAGKKSKGHWWLISAKGYQRKAFAVIGKEVVHPYDSAAKNRMAFAKICEAAFQCREKNPSLEFSDFDNQAKKYKEECTKNRKEYINVELVGVCLKECLIAEAATIAGKRDEAADAIYYVRSKLKEAKILAKETRDPKATKPNTIEKAIAKIQKQIDTTTKKNREFRNKKTTPNKIQTLSLT